MGFILTDKTKEYYRMKELNNIKNYKPNKVELAYMAGIMDGEGSVSIIKTNLKGRNPCHVANTRVAMLDKAALLLFKKSFGFARVSKDTSRNGYRGIYRWDARGPEVGIVLEALFPYLRVKRKQAKLVLRFLKTRKLFWPRKGVKRSSLRLTKKELEHRESLRDKVLRLNWRGKVKDMPIS